jgi:hypothetical protein
MPSKDEFLLRKLYIAHDMIDSQVLQNNYKEKLCSASLCKML